MSLLDHVWDLLFPSTCCMCGQEGSWLCQVCRTKLPKLLTAYCPVCGPRTTHRENVMKTHGFFFDELVSFIPYGTPWVERAIQNMKYGGMFGIATVLASELARRLAASHSDASGVVTWIPLHGRRLRERGFNQAERIGRAVAQQLGLEAIPLIAKTHQPAAQAGLGVQERATNLRGVFRHNVPRRTGLTAIFRHRGLDERQDFVITGKTVILVDDVVTTGATLSEAARVLRSLGCAKVIAVTIAYSPLRNTRQAKT